MNDTSRRAVVTGMGIIAPNGIGRDAWWAATRAGKSGIRPITRFDASKYATRLAGEVSDFVPTDFLDEQLIAQTDRSTWMALAATQMALHDADFDPSHATPTRLCVVLATSFGAAELTQAEMQNLWRKGPASVSAYGAIDSWYAALGAQISIRYGVKGGVQVIGADGAGALEALHRARRAIQRGAQAVISGGSDAPIAPYALTCQINSGKLSAADDPAAAYRPFDRAANGSVPAEGAALLLVEELEQARRRGAEPVYGEILSYAATHDAYHYARPAPDGRQLARAMSLALERAKLAPEQLDAVVADAAGTSEEDRLEANAIETVLGSQAPQVPIIAPTSMVGRAYAAGAALDVAAALLAMRDGCLPPIVNLDQPIGGCSLDFVRDEARHGPIGTVLVSARGFGGFNSALVLRRLM